MFEKTGPGTVTARVPHPLQFNKPRTTTGEIADATRREIGQHITVGWTIPADPAGSTSCSSPGRRSSSREQLFVTSLICRSQEEVFPFDELAFPSRRHRDAARERDGLQRRRRHDLAIQQETSGWACSLRYSNGKKEFTPTGAQPVEVTVGGLHAGGGLRVLFNSFGSSGSRYSPPKPQPPLEAAAAKSRQSPSKTSPPNGAIEIDVYSYTADAVIGSTRAARWAGIKPAQSATAVNSDRRSGKHDRVARAHLKQQRFGGAAQGQRRRESDRRADARHQADLPQHETPHVRGVCAERHPQAEFSRPLRHRVGEHAVEPERRQQRGERRRTPPTSSSRSDPATRSRAPARTSSEGRQPAASDRCRARGAESRPADRRRCHACARRSASSRRSGPARYGKSTSGSGASL